MVKAYNNKIKANILLAVVFFLFAATTILKHLYRDSFTVGLLAFSAEAALVGGIADWFAVTALFEKPLGFSWHTAIIPNNRDQIAVKVSELVSNELLSLEAVSSKLASVDLTNSITDGILSSFDKALLENKFQDYIGNKANQFDNKKLAATIDNLIKSGLKKEGISDEIRSLLVKAFEEDKHIEWLSKLLDKAIAIANKDTTRERIYKILKEQERFNEKNTGAGSFFVKMLLNMSRNSKHSNLFSISELLQQELVNVLADLKNPSNPIFAKLADNSADLVKQLDKDQTLKELLHTWKNGVLDRLALMEALQQLLASAVNSEKRKQEAAQWLADNIDNYRIKLKENENIKKFIDEILKSILQKVIASEHYLIGEITKETMGAFSSRKMAEFVNDKVGDDLQWIRINGSVVGAAAGTVIYLFTHLLFNPYWLPLMQGILK